MQCGLCAPMVKKVILPYSSMTTPMCWMRLWFSARPKELPQAFVAENHLDPFDIMIPVHRVMLDSNADRSGPGHLPNGRQMSKG